MNYYLPSPDVARYFAEWLNDAVGPKRLSYTGPRPFGDQFVDGFDLDLEAEASQVPAGGISANYAYFVNQLKALRSSYLISAAPQCVVPDIRLADAIKGSHFDMIFTQFYNTDQCSAKRGYEQLNNPTTDFTFNKWAEWLKTNSQNKAVKLYLGLSAGKAAANSNHYLAPDQASALIGKWKSAYPSIFGGVMLWEAKASTDKQGPADGEGKKCHSYGYWMKAILTNRFTADYAKGCSMPSAVPTSTKAPISTTSAAPTATATIATPNGACGVQENGIAYTCYGYSAGSCCSKYGYCGGNANGGPDPPSAWCGVGNCNPLFGDCDGKPKSSTVRSSTVISSSAIMSSSAPASSSSSTHVPSSSSRVVSSSSAVVSSSSHVVSSSSAVISSSSSHVVSSSSVIVSSASSTPVVPSSSAVLSSSSSTIVSFSSDVSSTVHSSSAVTSSSAPASFSSVVSSSVYETSSSASTPPASSSVASSSIYETSTPAVSSSAVSSSVHETSSAIPSAASSSISDASNSASTPYATPSIVYPHETPIHSSSASPSYAHTSSDLTYSSSSSSIHYPAGNASTPCTTSTQQSSSTPVHVASTTPVYVASSSSTPGAPIHGASSTSKGHGVQYPPHVTSLPGKDSPSSSASSTVKTVTTTYVDSCETGITTKTETITQTVCDKCTGDSVTSVYVCHKCGPSVVTITITKPSMPTYVASHPTPPAKPEGPIHGADKPQHSQPAKPVYGADVPKKQDYPVEHSMVTIKSTTVSIVYVMKTPVPVVPAGKNMPVPYSSAPVVGYPVKPTGGYPMSSGTGVPSKPSGTGAPTKPTYAPPQFTGAASHVGVGMTGLLAVVAGLLML